MTATPLPAALRLLAPLLNERLGGILVAIQQLIAHHFLRNPRLQPIILPLWQRLNRANHSLACLTARLAAGKPLRPSPPRKPRDTGRPATPRPRSPIPRAEAWLLKALGWHVAVHRGRLECLLAEPGMADLVAAIPALGRMLRPLCRMLALPPPCPPPARQRAAPPPTPQPLAPRPAPTPWPPPPERALPDTLAHPSATRRLNPA